MINSGKFLSSIYSDKIISLIIEEAINGNFQLLVIDFGKGIDRTLTRNELAAIQSGGSAIPTEIELELPVSTFTPPGFGFPPRKRLESFGRRQNVRYADLRATDSEIKKIGVSRILCGH